MPKIDEITREIHLDPDGNDAVLIISKDGHVATIGPSYEGKMPEHQLIIDGLCRALSSPVLCDKLRELVREAINTEPPVQTIKPPTLN